MAEPARPSGFPMISGAVHVVTIQGTNQSINLMIDWIQNPELPGIYDWNWRTHGEVSEWYFDDANVAFEFKIRWA